MYSTREKESCRPAMSAVLQRVSDVPLAESDVMRQLERNGAELIEGQPLQGRESSEARPSHSETDPLQTISHRCGTRPAAPRDVPVDGRIIRLRTRSSPWRPFGLDGRGRWRRHGIEYASFFARLGVKVTLVDRNSKPISFIDGQIVDELISQMESDGVTFLMNDGVASIQTRHSPTPHAELTLTSGRKISSSTVLYSIGRIAATDTLDLDRVGVEHDERGRLTVDSDYRTNVPHIYAAGDVIGFPALAATSSEQGRIAACRMFGIQAARMGTHYPYGIYSIPEISMVGKTEEELDSMGTRYVVGVARYREIARGQILGDETGLFKMLFDAADKRLLGTQHRHRRRASQ